MRSRKEWKRKDLTTTPISRRNRFMSPEMSREEETANLYKRQFAADRELRSMVKKR